MVKFYILPEVKGELQNASVSVIRNQTESENSYLPGALMLYYLAEYQIRFGA